MPLVFDATVGGASSNSFETVDGAQAYWDSRLFPEAWTAITDKERALVMATSTLVRVFSAGGRRVETHDDRTVYITAQTWTGKPATTTQRLPWPRIGMYDRNGNAIAEDVNPEDLRFATAELAAYLAKSDRMLDNAVAAAGISSFTAGPVSFDFKDDVKISRLLPESVYTLLVPSWLTDELIEPVDSASLIVVPQ